MMEQNVLLDDVHTMSSMDRDGNVVEVQATKYLICLSDGLRYGLDAEQVVEIITDHTITPLPCVPGYVRGVINLRGQIIPVIDLRLRLGKMPQEDCCIMVVNVENESISILVDGVEKMVDIPKDAILPVPTQQSNQKLVSGMCSLPGGGTMLILDCDLLLHG